MSPTQAPILPVYNLDDTLGAIVLGVILAAILYGLTTGQVFHYYQNTGQNDHAFMRCIILSLWLVDGVHVALFVDGLYFYTVRNFGNLEALARPNWSIIGAIPVTLVNDLTLSAVYAYRIWKLNKNWSAVVVIGVSMTVAMVSSLVLAVLVSTRTFEQTADQFGYLWDLIWACQVLADVTITISIIVVLRRERPMPLLNSGLSNVLKTLTVYIVNGSLLTSSCAIATIITCATMPNNLIFLGISMIKPKLMLNSMLALLNSRQSLREAMNVDKSVLTGLANLHTADDRIVFGIVSSAINESLSPLQTATDTTYSRRTRRISCDPERT